MEGIKFYADQSLQDGPTPPPESLTTSRRSTKGAFVWCRLGLFPMGFSEVVEP